MTTLIDWPADLPQSPLLRGYSRGVPPNTIETPNSAGPPNVRRRTTANEDPYSASMLMTLAQHTSFLNFWKTVLLDGALTFNHVDPESGAATEVRITNPTRQRVSGTHYLWAMQWRIQP